MLRFLLFSLLLAVYDSISASERSKRYLVFPQPGDVTPTKVQVFLPLNCGVSVLESSLQSSHTFNCARYSNWISIDNCCDRVPLLNGARANTEWNIETETRHVSNDTTRCVFCGGAVDVAYT